MNPVLALMENDSPDKFAEDVANAYFANPTHVRRLLNADCINECVDYVLDNQRVEFDLSDLAFFNEDEPFFSKPSRQREKRKHNKKAVCRKGSAKRFRDRSRKWQSENHVYDVCRRGLKGDWNMRGRALEKTGEVAFKTSHKMHTNNYTPFVPSPSVDETDDVTLTFGDVSMTMNCSNWRNYESQWASFCETYAWDEAQNGNVTLLEQYWNEVAEEEEEDLKNGRDLKTNLDKGLDDFDDEIFVIYPDDDDEIIGADCTQEQDTAEFSAVELAQITMRIATADPVQRARIRSFMATI